MSITLETPSGSGASTPVAKIPDVGDSVTLHIADVAEIDVRDFDTGQVETFDDGNPKKQKVITGIVISSEGGAKARYDGEDVDLEPGQTVTIFTGFAGFYAYREGIKQHGPVTVGDVLTWATDREEPPRKKGFNPFKVRTYTFRAAAGSEAAGVKAAEALYLERQNRPTIDAPSSSAYDPNDDPF